MSAGLGQLARPVNRVAAVFDALARLTAARSGLPPLDWNIDATYGATGIAHGTDEYVRRTVHAWADALRVLPDGEPAEIRIEAGMPVSYPGYLVAHAQFHGTAITVGGTLRNVGGPAW